MAVRDAPTCSCTVEDRRIPAFVLDNLLRRLFQPPRKFVARYVRAGDRVADLGCGPGHFTVPMSKAVREGGRVFAVDFDPDAIAKVREKVARLGLGHVVDARVASAADIDFVEAESLDFVLAEGLLCCMQDHAGAVAQIRRILRPEGKAWLSVMKFGRPDDPRTVNASEWTSILSTMRVLESGESLLSRWALVSPPP